MLKKKKTLTIFAVLEVCPVPLASVLNNPARETYSSQKNIQRTPAPRDYETVSVTITGKKAHFLRVKIKVKRTSNANKTVKCVSSYKMGKFFFTKFSFSLSLSALNLLRKSFLLRLLLVSLGLHFPSLYIFHLVSLWNSSLEYWCSLFCCQRCLCFLHHRPHHFPLPNNGISNRIQFTNSKWWPSLWSW